MTRPAVLVLDDNPAFVRAVAMAAEQAGLKARSTESPEDFALMLCCSDVSAAIVDCMLGDRNGLAILARIGAHCPDLPTLVVSGYGDSFLAQAEQLGRTHGLTRLSTLAKPFGIGELRSFLDSARVSTSA